MSLNGVSNTVFPNTLNGLDSLNVTNITIDGQTLSSLFVPYTGAQSNVDLNNKSLTGINGLTTGSATASGLVQGANVTATALTTTNTLKINSVPAGTTAKYLATNAAGNVIEADITTKYVPYTGATAHVNLNAKNLSNVLTYSGTNVQVTSTETTSLLATGLAQLGSLRISSVPAGSQTNLLAVDSAGNVIVGTAPASTQLNLSPTVSPTLYYFPFITSSSAGVQTVYTDNAAITLTYDTATKTLSPYRLKIQNVPAGTQTSLLAIDSAGNVIQGTSTPPTTLLTTQTGLSQTYYPTFVSTNTTGNKSYYVPYPATTGYDIYYFTGGAVGDIGVLHVPQLVIDLYCVLNGSDTSFSSTPASGGVVLALGLDNLNRVRTFSAGSPNVIATNTNNSFYPVFVNSLGTGIKDLYQDTVANDFNYNPSTNLLTVSNLTVSGTTTISGYAPLASPAFTGTPTAPTAAPGTNTTQIATTAFVTAAVGSVSGYLPLTGGTMTGSITYANTALTPITLSSANLTAYTYSIRDSFWTLPMLEFTTKTLSTFGSVSFGVPIVINNTSSTNLMSLPYSTTTPYTKSISNTGGDIFMSFTNRTTSPAANGSVVFAVPVSIATTLGVNNVISLAGASNLNFEQTTNNQLIRLPYLTSTSYIRTINNAGGDAFMTFISSAPTAGTPVVGNVTMGTQVVMGNTVGLYGVNGTSNDGVAMWLTSGGSACGSIVLSDAYGTTLQTATPTTSWGRYFAVGGQVFQDFYGGFEWRGTNTLGSTTWSTVTTVARMKVAQMGYRFGSMFDFSTPGTWDDSNSLFITTGGLGSTNSGVGIGYNTALDSGLMVSIAPNVAWKRMSYKASNYIWYINGNSQGLTLDTGGGLTFGTSGRGLTTADGATYGNVSIYGTGINGWNGYDINKRWTLMGWSGNTEAGFHDNQVSWIWRTTGNNFIVDRTSIIFNNVPQQNYSPNQVLIGNNGNSLQWGVIYSTYYYNSNINWKAGTLVASFYKASATAMLRVSGAASYYVSPGGMYYTRILWYNTSTGGQWDIYNYQFTNNASNHVSFPIMAQISGLPVGSYQVYMYTNGITDGNDHLYILSEILPS